ncbi:MAG: efflux transporter outer membrane subunit [Pseudomonadota bacterium]
MFKARLWLAPIAAAVMAACAVGPDYHRPEAKVAASFAGAETPAFTNEAGAAEFWQTFDDATLTRLVNESLLANYDLRIALSRIREARALRGESYLDLAPTITAGGGYTQTRTSSAQSLPGISRDATYYDAGFDAVWELDFFGRVRRGIEASNAELGAAEAGLHDAQVSVTAEVTRTYFELRGFQQQLEVANRNVANQRDTLGLAKVLLDNGRGTELDTSRAQAQLSGTLGTIGPLEASVARSIHRLSVLIGREPGALRAELAPAKDLPPLPTMTAVGNPSDLLRRRPDIRIAERQLAGATARVGIAIADIFPRVTFVGNLGSVSSTYDGLGDSGNDAWRIAPGISWAALDLGRVRARIGASRARSDGALLNYEQTVLRALEDTEDSLVTYARARDRLVHDQDAVAASGTASRLARLRYENGSSDFLQVLDAERIQLLSEDRLARSRTQAATSLIAVYKALGGGWESAPRPN